MYRKALPFLLPPRIKGDSCDKKTKGGRQGVAAERFAKRVVERKRESERKDREDRGELL